VYSRDRANDAPPRQFSLTPPARRDASLRINGTRSPPATYAPEALGDGLLQPGFDWPTWANTPEAQALRNDPDVLAAATPDQLGKLLTAVIREDRFNEGALGDSFESGFIAAIARRAKALAEEAPSGP